jgi:hypothetical protein
MQWMIFEYPQKYGPSENPGCFIPSFLAIGDDTIALPMRHGLYLLWLFWILGTSSSLLKKSFFAGWSKKTRCKLSLAKSRSRGLLKS